jgi:diadenosine tetraphosphate (Ap4A) HIT family hydrolase
MVATTLSTLSISSDYHMKYQTLEEAKKAGVAPWDLRVEELCDFHVTVFRDRFPVTNGHLLFVPQYNTDQVIMDCFESAMRYGRRMVADAKCDAFNIGINMGREAGQTVMYPHIHLIPRRVGDCADPVGGVRGVIPSQQNYKTGGYKQPA